jgi:hypothetical protein
MGTVFNKGGASTCTGKWGSPQAGSTDGLGKTRPEAVQ